MKNQIQTVNFHNQTLITLQKDGIAYVAMKPICENIGLDWDSQRKRIERDEVLNSVKVMMTATGSDSKLYKMLCLPIHYLNGWLFGVDVSRVKAEIKDKLITYKKECYQALFDYWNNGVAVNPRVIKINDTQAYQIQKAIKQKCQYNKLHYQTLYHAIYNAFGVKSYKDILASDFEAAMVFIMSFEFVPTLNLAIIQNILAHNAHQNRKAQDELDNIIGCIKHLINHLGNLQDRLNYTKQGIATLQDRL